MTIKKPSKSSVLISNSKSDAKITVEGDRFIVEIIGDEPVIIEKPGDYEYGDVAVTALEIGKEKYAGIINLIKVEIEDVKVVFALKAVELKKEEIDILANIDIVINPYESSTLIKNLINDLDPKICILLSNFDNTPNLDVEELKKELGISNIISDTSTFKIKSSDLPKGDEFVLSYYVI
jgi:hypothetical protein